MGFLQDALFIIDNAYDLYINSKNIFTRKINFKKKCKKIESMVGKRLEKIDSDIIQEFISLYNSTYEFININNKNLSIKMNCYIDSSNNDKYISFKDENLDIFIFPKDKAISVTVRSDKKDIPFMKEYSNELVYEGTDKNTQTITESICGYLKLFILLYINEYIKFKMKKKRRKINELFSKILR